ncbi:MAG TPA: hypothetical protein VFP05_18885 [Thermomicrobiales bacterium]|nr:hypothetical protein [Thermomicrobiales bacterium]
MTMTGAALVGLLATGVPTVASGTPTSFATGIAQCTIEPRSLGELERIVAGATPVPERGRPVSGDAIALESDTGRQITGVIEMLVACLNAGDRMRAYALYTDAYLAGILQPGDLPAVATPDPEAPDDATRIIAIELHAIVGGGVIATVTLDPALIPVHKIFEFILIPVDGGWRIDRVINEIDFSLP